MHLPGTVPGMKVNEKRLDFIKIKLTTCWLAGFTISTSRVTAPDQMPDSPPSSCFFRALQVYSQRQDISSDLPPNPDH